MLFSLSLWLLFIRYGKALYDCSELMEAKEDKDYDAVLQKSEKIYVELQNYLGDESIR
jgi:hypothetical protein